MASSDPKAGSMGDGPHDRDNAAPGETAKGETDTIFALSSAPGRAGIAVVRVSGPRAGAVCEAVAGAKGAPRAAHLRRFRDPASGEVLDRGLALWFPGPASATGEDVAEFHLHGGPAVLARLFAALGAFARIRPAEPGEFTRRGFENGKLDLTEAEGLADLLAAETEAQRRQALAGLEGAMRARAEDWRARLMHVLALCEAELDFPDEEDVPEAAGRDRLAALDPLAGEIRAALADSGRGERVREGMRVVLAGAPNAGKSTLLNAIAGRDVAIVSELAGTTRDVLEVRLDLGGYPVSLIDTAGLREAGDAVEREGVRRALAQARGADLVVWLAAPDVAGAPRPDFGEARVIAVRSKADLAGPEEDGALAVSATTGEGIADLLDRVQAAAGAALGGGGVLVARERQRRALEDCLVALERAAEAASSAPLELVAEDLRIALRALARLTGRVDVEQLLDIVFAEFCLGK